jgi:hypothetical protein
MRVVLLGVVSVRRRGWSIRAKIMTLAVVPLVAITGLSVFGVAATVEPALNLLDTIKFNNAATDRGEYLMVQLQEERLLSASAAPGAPGMAEVRKETDARFEAFKARWADSRGAEELSAMYVRVVEGFLSAMDTVPQLRKDFDAGTADAASAVNSYSIVIDAAYKMFAPLTYISDADLSEMAQGIYLISRSRELLSREDAAVMVAVADQRITAAEHTRMQLAIGARRQQHEEATAALVSPHKENFSKIFTGASYQNLSQMEDMLGRIQAGGRLSIDVAVWQSTTQALLSEMDQTEDAAADATLAIGNNLGLAAFTRPIVAGLIGLICAALALILALRTGRSVVRRLERLRETALSVANVQLPQAIAALREPNAQISDPALSEPPPVAVGDDEVGQVGHAFSAVHRTALRSAVDEAILRKGISEVFLNIARRSQALLHRQLTLLDRMERRTTSPQELEDLFKLDHMATRMRRHAEALVILAGSTPGRGWRHPVPVIDVVRGATSEIEDYVRVGLDRLPDVRISGRAVGDLIHLLAELLENATSFAPPHTAVRVHGELTEDALAIYVEDRGLGMSDEELADANVRLAEPPNFDPAESARLGLLVVAKLAARQGVTVHLRHSPYGGVTAMVLVPAQIVMPGVGDSTPAVASAAQQKEISAQAFAQERSSPDQATVSIVDGLPKRVRRAPQELAGSDAETTVAVTEDAITITLPTEQPGVPSQRSAEEIRARMSAFQSGTVRGRAHAVEAPEEGSASSGTHDNPPRD